MYRIAVVDDQVMYQEQIQDYITKYANENQVLVDITLFKNGQEIIDDREDKFDLFFLDIDMPSVNGMEVAKHIRKNDTDAVIVFITNLAHYAIDGYAVGALDYVLKPLNYSAFTLRLVRALDKLKKKDNMDFTIHTLNGIKCLNTDDIYYVEIENRRLHYHTKNGEYIIRGTLKQVEERLGAYHFVKCNQFYLVNLKYVSEIKGSVVVVGGDVLEISRRSKSLFAKALTDYIGGGL